jgi:outer membrane protein OmpA-like peptidoglycan-associated protein
MTRISLVAVVVAASLSVATGCASKKYVRNETAPTINKVNELDDITAKNSRDIKDLDARAQQGIQAVNDKTSQADQKAATAAQSAQQAQQLASNASNGVTSLTNVVANLDNYHPVAETAVHFGFDKAELTSKARKALDQLAAEVPNAKHWILVIDGNTDSVGPADYNYGLSQRRADSVIRYLAATHNIPARKIYVVGLGKDKPTASNKSSQGRAENRRVDVRLMTNEVEGGGNASQAAPPSSQQ